MHLENEKVETDKWLRGSIYGGFSFFLFDEVFPATCDNVNVSEGVLVVDGAVAV